MTETICPECGERNGGRVEFCGACGAFLAWDGPADTTAQAPPRAAGPAVTATHPSPVPGVAAGGPAAQAGPAPRPAAAQRPTNPMPAGTPSPVTGAFAPPHQQHRASGPAHPSFAAQAAAAPPPPPPPDAPCPRCGVENAASLRFCRKCGLALKGPTLHQGAATRTPAPVERSSWWSRLFGGGSSDTRRAARAAYRRSLPLRYRALRWVMALAGVAAVVGLLTVLGRNPVGWVTDRIEDLRGDLVQVSGLTAYGEPAEAAQTPTTAATGGTGGAVPSTDAVAVGGATSGAAASTTGATPVSGAPNPAVDLLDNRADTAWVTPWSADVQRVAAQAACVPPQTPTGVGAPGSVVIVPQQPITVRQLSVAAGLPKDDTRRVQQWRPKTLQLAYSDGRCQQVALADVDGLQQVDVDPVQSAEIRLSVVEAYPPLSDQPQDELAITDIRLFQRP